MPSVTAPIAAGTWLYSEISWLMTGTLRATASHVRASDSARRSLAYANSVAPILARSQSSDSSVCAPWCAARENADSDSPAL